MAYLKRIQFNWNKVEENIYPFNIEALRNTKELNMDNDVVFFIGENGTGKSTLMESIAYKCGFGLKGGRNAFFEDEKDNVELEKIMKLSWLPKAKRGFYLRSETLYSFADYIDETGASIYYGGSLHSFSHGETFLHIINSKFNTKGIYLLDEPEAALSPEKQLAFLVTLNDLIKSGGFQFIIATHSPIIMSYPNSTIYSFNDKKIENISYEDTEHYWLTKDFLNNREKYFKHMFSN